MIFCHPYFLLTTFIIPSVSKIAEDFTSTVSDILLTLNRDTVTVEGSSWIDKETGVWIKFSSKAVLDPKLITCSLWRSGDVPLSLEDNQSLVSNVIELACDDPVAINFSGISVALSHSATDLGGYELVMKELIDAENKTWKDLETTALSGT